ncbi:MAG: hypothetical protein LBR69_04700 [Endomicrobium sp.]|nr:hypothetical protein [Endomicrobium sp.]
MSIRKIVALSVSVLILSGSFSFILKENNSFYPACGSEVSSYCKFITDFISLNLTDKILKTALNGDMHNENNGGGAKKEEKEDGGRLVFAFLPEKNVRGETVNKQHLPVVGAKTSDAFYLDIPFEFTNFLIFMLPIIMCFCGCMALARGDTEDNILRNNRELNKFRPA